MRPIVRGNRPQKDAPIVFKEYAEARGELINRMGEFCSYCEMHLDASLAVEHVQPKKPEGADENITSRELDWDNFLLACTNCNSTKGNTDVVIDDYLWPDRDNTFRALKYSEGGLIEPALDGDLETKAQKTIELTGLDKHPLNDSKASDRRWLNRRETWDIAQRAKERLGRNDNADFREQIIDTATGHAYWSVWLTVFEEDPDMCKRLIEAFPGTATECFDAANDFHPISRVGGQC